MPVVKRIPNRLGAPLTVWMQAFRPTPLMHKRQSAAGPHSDIRFWHDALKCQSHVGTQLRHRVLARGRTLRRALMTVSTAFRQLYPLHPDQGGISQDMWCHNKNLPMEPVKALFGSVPAGRSASGCHAQPGQQSARRTDQSVGRSQQPVRDTDPRRRIL